MADEIEELIENKIEYEMTFIYDIDPNIEKLEETNQYEELYNSIKDKLTNDLLNKNLIDDNSFGKIVLMLNDSFNFFISGYPDIPDEFLFNENDNN